MKKFINCFALILLLIPVIVFSGCKNSNNASSVRNRVYYVTKASHKDNDISKSFTDKNMKIIFQETTFMVEFSNENAIDYGYYLGTYSTNEDVVVFTVTDAGGTYTNYENNPEKNFSVFSSLKYKKGKLYTEFVLNNSIYSFTLEVKN